MYHGNPYDNVMIEAVHELQQTLRPAPIHRSVGRWLSAFLRQRRTVIRLSLPDRSYPKTVWAEKEG